MGEIDEFILTDFKSEFVNRNLNIEPKAEKNVLQFIADFLYRGHEIREIKRHCDVVYHLFSNGYCYYFAHILEVAFKGGEICWAVPFGHIVWQYKDIIYDISGIYQGESSMFIPESFMGDTILDFKHIDKIFNTSKSQIENIITDYVSSYKINHYDILLVTAKYVYEKMRKDFGDDMLGRCVVASEMLHTYLKDIKIESEIVEGWCIYDDDSGCSDRCYDEHTWIECNGFYMDITASQFNSRMENKFPDIIVSKTIPQCMVKEEPKFQWLDEI